MSHKERVVDMVCDYFTNHIRSSLRVDIADFKEGDIVNKISMCDETKAKLDKALKLIPDNVVLERKVGK